MQVFPNTNGLRAETAHNQASIAVWYTKYAMSKPRVHEFFDAVSNLKMSEVFKRKIIIFPNSLKKNVY